MRVVSSAILAMILTISLMILLSFPAVAQQQSETAETPQTDTYSHYISDELFIFVHAGPGRNYRILGSIDAGAPVTRTDKDEANDFIEIIDSDGRQGWIEAEFLSDTQSIRVELETLRDQAKQATDNITPLRNELRKVKRSVVTLNQANSDLQRKLTQTENQLSTIESQNASAEKDEELRTMMVGGGLVAGGLLLGVIIAYLPKKRKRSDGW